jgi:hypothetical protein
VTLRQRRTGGADSVLDTVKIQYQVNEVVGDDELPVEVAVRENDGVSTIRFPIDGDETEALANVELLFTGAPVLFRFSGFTPSDSASYYVTVALEYMDGVGFIHNPTQARSQSSSGRAFELNTKARLMRLADMAAPPDSDEDGVTDDFADFGSTSSRPVSAPVFLSGGVTSFTGSLQVVLACGTPGASLIYTLDGSTPTSGNGIAGTCGMMLELTETTTLQAISIRDGRPDSAVTSRTYTRTGP